LVFSDEVYDQIVFDGTPFTSLLQLPQLDGRLFYVQSFSKTFAMAGWRIGYLVAPNWCYNACARIHRTINGPINTAVQRAAIAALSLSTIWLDEMLGEYQARRDLVVDALANITTIRCEPPQATFSAWVGHPSSISSDALVARAIEQGVSVRSGAEFGHEGESHLSVSFSIDRDGLRNGLARLVSLLTPLSVAVIESDA
jgi:aspartate aminotransferase